MGSSSTRRVRVERGIYRQPNGKYAVCWRHAGRLRFRIVGFDLAEARRHRLALIAATREASVPVWPTGTHHRTTLTGHPVAAGGGVSRLQPRVCGWGSSTTPTGST
jgi:hypothetical protein